MEIRVSNNSRQNFGALKVDKGATKVLQEYYKKDPVGMTKVLEHLDELGQEFRDYKYCDLLIDKDLKPILDLHSHKHYYRLSNVEIQGVDLTQGGSGCTLGLKGYNQHSSSEIYCYIWPFEQSLLENLIKNCQNCNLLDKYAELLRAFEMQHNPKITRTELIKNIDVDSFISRYGKENF